MQIPQRIIGGQPVSAIGLGCMSLSHAYGTPPDPDAASRLLLAALDAGVNFFDTAALYGFGGNETLVGRVLKPHRTRIFLASKCGMTGVNGKRVIDGRPETLKRTCDESLSRLQTDVLDLYYLHRRDFQVPMEESVGALGDLVRAGKVRNIGLSEVSAKTIRVAHAIHPIAALQSEYSLWTREAEIGALQACKELGIAYVAFSPLARAFLTGKLTNPATQLLSGDIRLGMPRFTPENYKQNLLLLEPFRAIAKEVGCTMAQLALAWLLHVDPCVIPIPGTTSIEHLTENMGATNVVLSSQILERLGGIISNNLVSGNRYNDATQREIDTEIFAS